jgi:predicted dithiol-disulfide oxidoreductase (DUF899 family)
MTDHEIGTREEWLAAREQLLRGSKAPISPAWAIHAVPVGCQPDSSDH